MPNPNKELDNRETQFVREYLIDLNPERAAVAAGYSKAVARTKSYQWVSNGEHKKPHVIAAIQRGFTEKNKRQERSADEVINLLWKMMEYSLDDYFNVNKETGEITAKPFDELPEGASKLISGIKFKKRSIKQGDDEKPTFMGIHHLEYKMPNKDKMVELLMKHYGQLIERKQTGLDEKTLALLFAGHDAKYVKEVKAALIKILEKRDG